MSRERFLLVKGKAGLGNRMLGLLTGILYARIAGRRLVVDWSDALYSDGGNAFDRLFRCPGASPMDAIPDGASVAPAIWQGHLHRGASQLIRRKGLTQGQLSWRETSVHPRRIDYAEDVAVWWSFHSRIGWMRPHFRGPFQELAAMSDEDIARTLLREDLELQPAIRERIDRFRSAHFTGPTVGVHVRYADYRGRLGRTLARLDRMLRREPELRVFLCTDSAPVRDLFAATYPGLISTPHWYPEPGQAIHTHASRPDRTESAIEALVDMYLLAACDRLVVDSSSSFAQVAVLLSAAREPHVVDVAPRGKRKPTHRRRALTRRLLQGLGAYAWAPRAVHTWVRLRAAMQLEGVRYAPARMPERETAEPPELATGFVASGGERVYYESVGSGEAVVLGHGLGGSHAVWFQQVPVLAHRHQVVTWDQRGFARSSNEARKAGPEAAVADLAALLDGLSIERAHVVGQSMGGWAALGFALAHPARVRSLVLADTIAGIQTPAIQKWFDELLARAPRPDAPQLLGRHPALGRSLARRDPARAFLYQQIASVAPPPPVEMAAALRATAWPLEAVAELRVPTLFVVGSQDELFPPAVIREAASRISGARVVEIADAGHSPYFEQPEEWNRAVFAFIAENRAR